MIVQVQIPDLPDPELEEVKLFLPLIKKEAKQAILRKIDQIKRESILFSKKK